MLCIFCYVFSGFANRCYCIPPILFYKVGDRLPSMVLFEDSPENEINIRELAANKKIIIFGVHGAFTPDCSKVVHVLINTAARKLNLI